MRIIVVIYTLMLIWSGLLDAQKTEPSSLEQLTENFLSLSRISNAISLVASAAQNTMKPREVISEFLKVAPEELTEILSIDTETAISLLNTLENEVKSFSKSVLTPEKILFKINTQLHQVDYILSYNQTMDFVDIKVETEQLITTNKLELNCSNFNSLVDLLDRDGKNSREKRFNTHNQYQYDDYSKDIKSFVNCYKSIEKLYKKMKKLELMPKLSNYSMAMITMKDLYKTLELLKVEVPKLNGDIEESKKLWKPDNAIFNLGKNISGAYNTHLKQSIRFSPPLPILTVSFIEPEDMDKVQSDLNGTFFKKHFVKGAKGHVEMLSSSLEPFFKTSKEIQTVSKLWIPFSKLGTNAKNIRKASALLYSFGETHSIMNPGEINKTIATLEKCTVQPETGHEDALKQFETQEMESDVLRENIVTFQIKLKKFVGSKMENKKYLYNTCLKKVLKSLSDFDDNDDLRVAVYETSYAFYKCTKEKSTRGKKEYLLNVIKRVEDVVRARKDVLDSFEKVQQMTAPTQTISIEQVWESSKVSDVIACLNQRRYNPLKLVEVLSFLWNLLNFPSSENLKLLSSYINDIFKIKSSLAAVESNMFKLKQRVKRSATNPILIINGSETYVENLGIFSIALNDLAIVQKRKTELSKIEGFTEEIIHDFQKHREIKDYEIAGTLLKKLLKQVEGIEMNAKDFEKTGDIMKMADIFEKVSAITGLEGEKEQLKNLIEKYERRGEHSESLADMKLLLSTQLDFALYHSRLMDGQHSVEKLKGFFDKVFGHVQSSNSKTVVIHTSFSPLVVVGFCIATVFLLVMGCLMIYGCTSKGRQKYHNLYLYYFGKQADFEKRWRYSSFADEQDGKNTLLDAVREVNKTNLLISLKKGAYINAYNNFGNTALHAATKGLYPELVEILIRHGADRSLLNVKNRTAEQLIPENYERMQPDKVEKCERIKNIFKKYRKKKFKKCVPLKFPVTSFHIFVEDRTDNELTNHFKDTFESITSIEVSPTTTHLVVKTNPDGVLETDRLDLLFWIFYGAIIVKESWMSDCLDNMKLIEKDFNYLVEKVNYKGVIYDTVLPWSNSMAKSEIPFLYGVYVAVVMNEYANMQSLTSLVLCQGGVFLDEFPLKKNYRIGSRPYLHANLGPLFIIHDGTVDLNVYKQDKDKMYTLFTEEEFISFMLKREVIVDMRANPITVSKDEE